jgi:hypothetical protein
MGGTIMTRRWLCVGVAVSGGVATLLLATAVSAYTAKGVGLVTTLQGRANLTREAAPPVLLKFRDDVFLKDVINTERESLARVLLRGSNLLTIRELSQVTIEEQALPEGPRSVISLFAGKIRATVSRALLRRGEEVEIRTPQAVAAVRGTDLILLPDLVAVLAGEAVVSGLAPNQIPQLISGGNFVEFVNGIAGPVLPITPTMLNQLLAGLAPGQAVRGEKQEASPGPTAQNTAVVKATAEEPPPSSPPPEPPQVTPPPPPPPPQRDIKEQPQRKRSDR